MDVANQRGTQVKSARNSYQNVILLVGVVSQMGSSMPGQGIPTLAYFFQTELSLSLAQVGLFGTAKSIGSLASLIACGWLADRIGVRILLLVGQVMMGAFVIAMGFTASFEMALLTLIPVGLGSSMINPSISKAIMYWFAPRMRATAMSIKQTGVPLGGAIASAALPALAIAFGWRTAVIALGIAVAIAGIVSFALYREFAESDGPSSKAAGVSRADVIRLLTNRDVLLASAIPMPLVGIQFAIVTYFLLYLKDALLVPIVLGGLFLALTQISSVFGRVAWGVASDRVFHGSRRNAMLFVVVLSTASVTALAMLPPSVPIWLVLVIAVLLGATCLSWHGVHMALIGELAGKELTGIASGFSLTLTQIGIMAAPPLFGLIVDQTDSYRLAWLVMAGLSASSLLFLLPLRERPAQR